MSKRIINWKSLVAFSSLGALTVVNNNYVQNDIQKIASRQENDNLEKTKASESIDSFNEGDTLETLFSGRTASRTMDDWLRSQSGIATFNEWVKSSSGKNVLKPTFVLSQDYTQAVNSYVKDKRSKTRWSNLQAGRDSYNLWRVSGNGFTNLEPLFKASDSFTTKQNQWFAAGPSRRSKAQWLAHSESDSYYQSWAKSDSGKQALIPVWKRTTNYEEARDSWLEEDQKPTKDQWLSNPASKPYYIAWKASSNGKATSIVEWKKTSDYQSEKTKWINLGPKISKDSWLSSDYSTPAYHSWRKSHTGLNLLVPHFKTLPAYTTALNTWLSSKTKRSKEEWLNTKEWYDQYQTWRKTTQGLSDLEAGYKKSTTYNQDFGAWKNLGPKKKTFQTWLNGDEGASSFEKFANSDLGKEALETEYKQSAIYSSNLRTYLATSPTKRNFDYWKTDENAKLKYDDWFPSQKASDFSAQYLRSSTYQTDLQAYIDSGPKRLTKSQWFGTQRNFGTYFNAWKDADNDKTNQWFKEAYRQGNHPSSWKVSDPKYAFYWEKDVPAWLTSEKAKRLSAEDWLYSSRGDQAFLAWTQTPAIKASLLTRWKTTSDYRDKKAAYATATWKQRQSKDDWLKLDDTLTTAQEWLADLNYNQRSAAFLANYKASSTYRSDLQAYLDTSPAKRSKQVWATLPASKTSYDSWKVIAANEEKLIAQYKTTPGYQSDLTRFVNDQKAKVSYSWWKTTPAFKESYQDWVANKGGEKLLTTWFQERDDYPGIKAKWLEENIDSPSLSFEAFLRDGDYSDFSTWFNTRATNEEKAQIKRQYFTSSTGQGKYQSYQTNLDNTRATLYRNFGLNQWQNYPRGTYVSNFLNSHNFNNQYLHSKYQRGTRDQNKFLSWFNQEFPDVKALRQSDTAWLGSQTLQNLITTYKNNPANEEFIKSSYLDTQWSKSHFKNWKRELQAQGQEKLKPHIIRWRGVEANLLYDQWVDTLQPFTKNVWDDFKLSPQYQSAKDTYVKDTRLTKRSKDFWLTHDDFQASLQKWTNSHAGNDYLQTKWRETKDFETKLETYKQNSQHKSFDYFVTNVIDSSKYSNWKANNHQTIAQSWQNHQSDYKSKLNQWKTTKDYTKSEWLDSVFAAPFFKEHLDQYAQVPINDHWMRSDKYKNLKTKYISRNLIQFNQWAKTPDALDKYYEWINSDGNKNQVVAWWKQASPTTRKQYEDFWISVKKDGRTSTQPYYYDNDKNNMDLNYDYSFKDWFANMDKANNTIEKWVQNASYIDGYINFLRMVPQYDDMDEYAPLYAYWLDMMKKDDEAVNKWFDNKFPHLDTKTKFYNHDLENNELFIDYLSNIAKKGSTKLLTSFKKYYKDVTGEEPTNLTLFNWDFEIWSGFIGEAKKFIDHNLEGEWGDDYDFGYHYHSFQTDFNYYQDYKRKAFFALSEEEKKELFVKWGNKGPDRQIRAFYGTTNKAKQEYEQFLTDSYRKSKEFAYDFEHEWKFTIKMLQPELLVKSYNEQLEAMEAQPKDLTFEQWYNQKPPSYLKAWREWINSDQVTTNIFAQVWKGQNYQDENFDIDLSDDEFANVETQEYSKRFTKWQTQNNGRYTYEQWLDESGGFINALWEWIDVDQDKEAKGLQKSIEVYQDTAQYQKDLAAWIAQGPKKDSFETWYKKVHKEKRFKEWIGHNLEEKPDYGPMYEKWEASDDFVNKRRLHIEETGIRPQDYKKGYVAYDVAFLRWNVQYKNTGEFYERVFQDQFEKEYQDWVDPNVRSEASYLLDKEVFPVNLKKSQWDNIDTLIKAYQDEIETYNEGEKAALFWSSYWEFKHRPYWLHINDEDHEYYNYFTKDANFVKSDEYKFHLEKWSRQFKNTGAIFYQTRQAREAYQNWKSPIKEKTIADFKADDTKHQEIALKWANIWTNGFDLWLQNRDGKRAYNTYKQNRFSTWHQKGFKASDTYQSAFEKWKQDEIYSQDGSWHNWYKHGYGGDSLSQTDFNTWKDNNPLIENNYKQSQEYVEDLQEWMEKDDVWPQDFTIHHQPAKNWHKALLQGEYLNQYLKWEGVNRQTKRDYIRPGNSDYLQDFNEWKQNNLELITTYFKDSDEIDSYYNSWVDPQAPQTNDFDYSEAFLSAGKTYLKNLPGEQYNEMRKYFADSKFAQDEFIKKLDDKEFFYFHTDEYQQDFDAWLGSGEFKLWFNQLDIVDAPYQTYAHNLEANWEKFYEWTQDNLDWKQYFTSLTNQEKATYWQTQDQDNYDTAFNNWFTNQKTQASFESKYEQWADFVTLVGSDALTMFDSIYKQSKYLLGVYQNWKAKMKENDDSEALWLASAKYKQIYGDWKAQYGESSFAFDFAGKKTYQEWKKSKLDSYLVSRFLIDSKQTFYQWRDRDNNGFSFYLQDGGSNQDYNAWRDPLVFTETSYQTSDQIREDFLEYKIPSDVLLVKYGEADQSDDDYQEWGGDDLGKIIDYDDFDRNAKTQADHKAWITANKNDLKKIMFDSGAHEASYEAWDDPSIIADDDDVDVSADEWNREKIKQHYEASDTFETNLDKFRKGESDLYWYQYKSPQSNLDYQSWVDPNVYTEAQYKSSDVFKTKLKAWFDIEDNSFAIYLTTRQAQDDYADWTDPRILTERDYLRSQFNTDYQEWLEGDDALSYYEKTGPASDDYAAWKDPNVRTKEQYEETSDYTAKLESWSSSPTNGKATYGASSQSNSDYGNWEDSEKYTKAKFDDNYKNGLHDAVNTYFATKSNGIALYKGVAASTSDYNGWLDPNARTARQYDGNIGGEFNKDLNAWLTKDNYANLIVVYKGHADSQRDLNSWWSSNRQDEADYLLSQAFTQDLTTWSRTKSHGVSTYNLDEQSLTDYNSWRDPLVRKKNEYEFSSQFNIDLNEWSSLPNQLALNKYLSLPKSSTDYSNWKDPLQRSKVDFDNNRDGEYDRTYNQWLQTQKGRSDALAIFRVQPYAIAEYGRWRAGT